MSSSTSIEPAPPEGFTWATFDAAPASSTTSSAALLFDCDGVLVETEELHRVAYNMAFDEFGLAIEGTPVVRAVTPTCAVSSDYVLSCSSAPGWSRVRTA